MQAPSWIESSLEIASCPSNVKKGASFSLEIIMGKLYETEKD
jgi:hypothetical protein